LTIKASFSTKKFSSGSAPRDVHELEIIFKQCVVGIALRDRRARRQSKTERKRNRRAEHGTRMERHCLPPYGLGSPPTAMRGNHRSKQSLSMINDGFKQTAAQYCPSSRQVINEL
jgi:hypothetical protein